MTSTDNVDSVPDYRIPTGDYLNPGRTAPMPVPRQFPTEAFPELEDQQCGFTTAFDRRAAGYSPGRVDALVWAISELMVAPMPAFGIYEYYRRLANDLP